MCWAWQTSVDIQGGDIYKAVLKMMNEKGIDVMTVVSVAPAMIGKERGLGLSHF